MMQKEISHRDLHRQVPEEGHHGSDHRPAVLSEVYLHYDVIIRDARRSPEETLLPEVCSPHDVIDGLRAGHQHKVPTFAKKAQKDVITAGQNPFPRENNR